MKDLEIYEVVKELEFLIGLDRSFILRGKILKLVRPELDNPFKWKVSHYCKPNKDAIGVRIPSSVSENSSIRDAERNMLIYVESFKDIGVEKNAKY